MPVTPQPDTTPAREHDILVTEAHRELLGQVLDKWSLAVMNELCEYLEAWGPPDIAFGGQQYCRWGPVI
ncbi:MAG: hypothetical protein V7738_16475, partial [Dietzia maris]